MHFKKALSVFMAALMLMSVMSLGLTAAADEINYAAQYEMLADALMNEHVRELTNYKVSNTTTNSQKGFDREAKGFIYDHTVVAEDNETSDILRASNRFYYIAESLMSYTYGVGCYDAGTLVSYITEKLKPYFEADGGVLYEDFYGHRYDPTPEEIEAYNKAVEELTANGMEIDKINLPTYGIMFIEKSIWEYYNTDTILRYFMGNTTSVNAGNYYHRFSFVVQTSVNAVLEDCKGIDYVPHNTITIRTAAYQFTYKKFYNETMSKSYYAFDVPSLSKVYNSFGTNPQYGFGRSSADLSQTENGVTLGGQAAAYLIATRVDTTTVPELKEAYNTYAYFLNQQYTDIKFNQWDEAFSSIKESEFIGANADLTAFVSRAGIVHANGDVSDRARELKAKITAVREYAGTIFSDKYSNEALAAMFGDELGSVIRLTYLFRGSQENPTRIVRNSKSYTVTNTVANDIINDIDALISPREGEVGSGDTAIANRVATILSQILNVGDLLGTGKEIEYENLGDLVGKVLAELVFTDSIINMLVELIYPMLVELIVDNLGSIDVIGKLVTDLVGTILVNNKLAIYPDDVGNRIAEDYGSKPEYASRYADAVGRLRDAGENWENVDFENMHWGVDAAPTEKKADVFLESLCVALSGFTRLLVCLLCGDYEYNTKDIMNVDNFGRYFDLELIPTAWITSQGLYTKVFIPLYRVLGIPETISTEHFNDDGVVTGETIHSQGMFLTRYQYHRAVVADRNVALKEAVRPIIRWVTEIVAKRPIETVMKLLPNLVHFLSREGTTDFSGYRDDWHGDAYNGDNQKDAHKGYSLLQTHNLVTILDNIFITISIIGLIPVDLGSIAGFFPDSTLDMLGSLSGLLKSILNFTYKTDAIKGYEVIAYTNEARTEIVLPGTEAYDTNPDAYPVKLYEYYSDEEGTSFSFTETETHTVKHGMNPIYNEEDFYIPMIPEGMLTSVGTVDPATNTIKLKINNEDTYGQVFVFLLRYVLSAVGYRYDVKKESLPSVIECLGLDLSGELFLGLGLEDIVNNVMIHPDAAICALLELFYSGESGDLYTGKGYSYPPKPIDYHNDILLNKNINPTLTYGSSVRYSQYWTKENADDFIANLTPLADDVLKMIGLEGMENGLSAFLDDLLSDLIFTDDIVNMLFNLIYQLLAGLNAEELGFDIPGIAKAALDVDLSPAAVAATLKAMVGETPAWEAISRISDWSEMFPEVTKVDPDTGEEYTEVEDVELQWGVSDPSIIKLNANQQRPGSGEVLLKSLASLLSPAGFLIKFLFMDKDLSILGLINLPGYAGYQYAFIGLLEALSCPGILSYKDYYEASTRPVVGDANAIYYLFAPLLNLIEKVKADPINTVLSLIPNLLFFISIGGFNDLVNNLVHFAYVLLDILKPIINGYDLVSGLLANLEIEGLNLQLSLPLDVDFNALVSDLLGSLLGDTLTIEGISIKLPYIDLYTLCVGTLEQFTSAEGRKTVFLNAVGGGDLLTAILRVALEILYIDENHVALSQIIAGLAEEGRLDAYDEETLYLVLHGLIGLIEEYEVIDIILFAVYKLITVLVPIADTLAERLSKNDMTIMDLIDSAGNQDEFIANLGKLLEDPDKVEPTDRLPDADAALSLFDRIKLFFEKIKLFFQNLFKFG